MQVSDVPRLARAGSLELAARRIVEGMYGGKHRSPFTGSATEFHDHRPYQAGDDLRSVDWRAFARSDHLLIRRYREERDLPVVIAVDNSASMDYGDPNKLSWARLAAATLALLTIDQGDRLRLGIGNQLANTRLQEVGGPGALAPLVAQLEAMTASGDMPLSDLMTGLASVERRSLIIIISDILEPVANWRAPCAALAARGHDLALLQVLDSSELSLPADWGPSHLVDPEGRSADLSCDTAKLHRSYDRAMQEHLRSCQQQTAACRADLVLAQTDKDVGAVLGDWLHRRRQA